MTEQRADLVQVVESVAEHFIEKHGHEAIQKAIVENEDLGELDWHHTITEALEEKLGFDSLLESKLLDLINKKT